MKLLLPFILFFISFFAHAQADFVRELDLVIPMGTLNVVDDGGDENEVQKDVSVEVQFFYSEEGEEFSAKTYEKINEAIEVGGADVNRQYFNITHEGMERKLVDDIGSQYFKGKTFTNFQYNPEYFLKKLSARNPGAESKNIGKKIIASMQSWYGAKKTRINSAIIRTIIGGSVAHVSYIQGGLSAEHALNLAIFIGVFNFVDQFFTEETNEFLSTNIFQSKYQALFGRKINVKKSSLPNIFKRYLVKELFVASLIETAFIAITQLAQVEMSPELFLHSGLVVTQGALFSVMTQGFMDTGLAMEFTEKMERVEDLLESDAITTDRTKNLMRKLSRYEKIVNYGGMGTALTWLSAAITGTMGLPISNYIYAGLGITGVANHIRIDLNRDGSILKKYYARLRSSCSLNLHLIE